MISCKSTKEKTVYGLHSCSDSQKPRNFPQHMKSILEGKRVDILPNKLFFVTLEVILEFWNAIKVHQISKENVMNKCLN